MKLTEEERAELLASNVSRDLVERVLDRMARLESALESAIAEAYVSDERECPCCFGEWRFGFGGGHDGFNHGAECEAVALGLDAMAWTPGTK
jgi:hypothetical protein